MPELLPVLTKKAIQERVEKIAREISADYQGRPLVMIGVLNGAFIFMADLIRHLTVPVQIDFVRISSYGSSSASSGSVQFTKSVEIDIRNKDIIIVEDIVDTGLSMACLIDHIKSFEPKSIRICAFIDKTERREQMIRPDYTGHQVSKGFLVGYGLDYAQNYRWLPEIFELKF